MAKIAILNAKKMDFDGSLDFTVPGHDVVVWDETTLEDLAEHMEGCDAIVTKEMVLPPEVVAAFPEKVKLIVEAGTGYNNIPLDAAREKGITVCNIPAYSSERVAHTAVMLMLMLASSMQAQMTMLARGDRRNFIEHLQVPHVELNGKTLGVVGYGNIGRTVVKIARAMDMSVLVYTRTKREDEEGIRFVTLEEVLKESDVVSLHCPLNEETKHLIGKDELAMMKPTAFLINTARGALIDEPALIDALEERRIGGAGLDVQETEPPVWDNPLYILDNVVLTPHMGWKGLETRQRLAGIIRQDIEGFFAGEPVNVVS